MDAALIGSRFTDLIVIGKGSYGIVYKAFDREEGTPVALKHMKNVFRHVADAARVLREMKLLRLLQASPDVVHLKTILLPSKRNFTDVVLVFELMEADLHQVIKLNHDLQPDHHQWFLFQMLRAVSYMHQAAILHRDLKPRNMLLNSDCKLKICDMGLARIASTEQTSEFWTDYVATRWYRAPELCGSFYATYTPQVDIWSIGCVFAEVLLRRPLFMGKDVVHQLQLITDILGTPPPESIAKIQNKKARRFLASMPHKPGFDLHRVLHKADPRAVDLLKRLLTFDPDERISAADALHHPYFDSLQEYHLSLPPVSISPSDFSFDESCMSVEDLREIMYTEISQWHPHLQVFQEIKPTSLARSVTCPCVNGSAYPTKGSVPGGPQDDILKATRAPSISDDGHCGRALFAAQQLLKHAHSYLF